MTRKPWLRLWGSCLALAASGGAFAFPFAWAARQFIISPRGLLFFEPSSVLAYLGWVVLLSVSILAVSRAGLYLAYLNIAASLLLAVYHLPDAQASGVPGFVAIASGVALSGAAVAAIHGIRLVFLRPELRWWKQSVRYLVKASCSFRKAGSIPLGAGELRNLSLSGALFAADQDPSLAEKDGVVLAFQCLLVPLVLSAQVIRVSTDPEGGRVYGVVFKDLAPLMQRELQGLIRLLEELGMATRNQ